MEIMECRHTGLERTLDGLNTTGVPLLCKYQESYNVAGYTDDMGIYYFIPKIAKIFGLSIDSALQFFHCSLIGLGAVIGIACLSLVFKRWYSRLFMVLGQLLLAQFVYEYQDVYIASHFAVSAIIPFFILMTHKTFKLNVGTSCILAACGIVLGYCNMIRLHSGTGVLLFIFLWILFNRQLFTFEKIGSLLIVITFSILPYLHFAQMEKNCREFIVAKNPSFQQVSDKHPTWHSIYRGLSYLGKKHVSDNSDTASYNAAAAEKPDVIYCSKEYSKILKFKVFEIVKEDPIFVLKTIRAKVKALCKMIWKYANVGLLLSLFVIFPLRNLIPFVAAMIFYALPGVLVWPESAYVLGMYCVSLLLAIYVIGLGLERYCAFSPVKKAWSGVKR